jgi:mannose-6-phosphate isomerase-like protein (cupin superfamily)
MPTPPETVSPNPLRQFVSSREPNRVLHAIVDTTQVTAGRVNACSADQWLQICVVPLSAGAALGPHTHLAKPAQSLSASPASQEAWLVLRGSLRIALFDEDQRAIHESTLSAGQLLVTFGGGHAFSGAAPDTLLLECKNGPYCGKDYVLFEERR